LCSHIFLVLWDHVLGVCLHLKVEFCSCARGLQWSGTFHFHWWTAASIKLTLLFSTFHHSVYASKELPFFRIIKIISLFFSWQILKCRIRNLNAETGPSNPKMDPVFSDFSGTRYSPNNLIPWFFTCPQTSRLAKGKKRTTQTTRTIDLATPNNVIKCVAGLQISFVFAF